MDKVTEALVLALKEAVASPEPLPLYKAGKQPGLFASRVGVGQEAAQKAVADGLLCIVRTENKSKSDADAARITPRGIRFLCQHESPRAVLEELLAALQAQREQTPRWHEEMKAQLQAITNRFHQFLERQSAAFDLLARRAEEALRRIDQPPAVDSLVPWQLDALDYLDARRMAGRADPCLFPELFQAVRDGHPGLALPAYHQGLIQLRDRGVVELIPFDGPASSLAEPEHALLEGAAVLVAVRRS